jgi:hypothetical protein
MPNKLEIVVFETQLPMECILEFNNLEKYLYLRSSICSPLGRYFPYLMSQITRDNKARSNRRKTCVSLNVFVCRERESDEKLRHEEEQFNQNQSQSAVENAPESITGGSERIFSYFTINEGI